MARNYVQRRGATYHFRMGVPERLRPIIGKREFTQTLDTKEEREARRLALPFIAKAFADIATAEKQLLGDKVAAGAFVHDAEPVHDEEPPLDDRPAMLEYELRHERELRQIDADHLRLNQALLRQAEAKAATGRPASGTRSDAAPSADKAMTVTRMFGSYASQPGMKLSTMNQFRSIIEHLVSFLGHNEAKRVSHADLVRWLEHLQTEPIASGHRKGQLRSATTINDTYLAAVKALFAYGKGKLLIDSNPALEVQRVRAQKKPKLRERDFTTAERKTILSAALEADGVPKGRRDAVRWVPWLCAYSGARVGEMAQLRKEDVQQVDGIWTVRITPEAGTQKTNEARLVPLHDDLIERGFLAFVSAAPQGPLFYNPAKARGGKVKSQSVKVGHYLAQWVRGLGLVDVPQPNHAWRHTFKTICREAGIEAGLADAICGHAAKTAGAAYGSYSVVARADAMASFPRFAAFAA